MRPGRRIGFDYGQVRIGVAVSDSSGLIASPLGTLAATSPELAHEIGKIIEEYDPIYLVIGAPKHLSGADNPSLTAAYGFGDFLSEITNVPIHFIDERLSTVTAAKKLREAGHNTRSSKGLIDAMAAVGILESALNRERIAGSLD